MTPAQETIDRLYRSYRRPIHSYLSRMTGSAQDAEDLTQEVFLKACRQLPVRQSSAPCRHWLFQIATYACFDQFRRNGRRPRTEPVVDEALLVSPGDPFEQAETAATIATALARLSERHRAALILKDVHGFKHAEIAEAMEISEGAAQILLHRARKAFRDAYVELVPDAPVGCPTAHRVAIELVGETLTDTQRQELADHAKVCPECRRLLAGRQLPVGGLGFFLLKPSLLVRDIPLDPPPVPLTPPIPPVAAEFPGILSQLGTTLSSKVGLLLVAGAIATGGQVAIDESTRVRPVPQVVQPTASAPTAARARPESHLSSAFEDRAAALTATDRRDTPEAGQEPHLQAASGSAVQSAGPSTGTQTGTGEPLNRTTGEIAPKAGEARATGNQSALWAAAPRGPTEMPFGAEAIAPTTERATAQTSAAGASASGTGGLSPQGPLAAAPPSANAQIERAAGAEEPSQQPAPPDRQAVDATNTSAEDPGAGASVAPRGS